jgi:hypothetical protein
LLLPSSENHLEVAGSKIIRNEHTDLLNEGVFFGGELQQVVMAVEWLGFLHTQITQCSKPDPEIGCSDCGRLWICHILSEHMLVL